MSRTLTRREKVLVIILAVLVVILSYFSLVYRPVQETLASAAQKRADLEQAIELEHTRSRILEQRRRDLAALAEAEGGIAPMAVYDNAQNVLTELSFILARANTYELSFPPVVSDGSLARRSIGVTFTCAGYEDARSILNGFYASRYRCQIGDFSITALADAQSGASSDPDLARNGVRVSMTATFYELIATH